MEVNKLHPRMKEWVQRAKRTNRIAHAYLLVGKKGAGKTQTALYFAQAIFCPEKESPCGQCTDCLRIEHSNHPDIHHVVPEGQSIKIDQVRQLQKEFSYRGLENDQKVYIIEGLESMTQQAANSLLKFLEDPHPGTVALLLTANKQQVLPTIISRCQEVHLPAPSVHRIAEYVGQDHDQSLARIASHITADVDEAAKLCASDWFAELKSIVIQLTEGIKQESTQAAFVIQDRWMKVAKEKGQTDIGLDLLLFWFKDTLYSRLNIDQVVYMDQKKRLAEQSVVWTEAKLTRAMTLVLEAKRKLQANVHPQLLLEQLVLRLQVL